MGQRVMFWTHVTLQFGFPADVWVRLATGQTSLLAGIRAKSHLPCGPAHPVLCPAPGPFHFLSSPSLLSCSTSGLFPLVTLRLICTGVINSFIKAIKRMGAG